jgi:mannan endo-1,4-beta-mannosidase
MRLLAVHAYPEHWGTESQADPVGWTTQWIKDHVTIQKSLNKPVILEEYGRTTDQYNTYNTWYGHDFIR